MIEVNYYSMFGKCHIDHNLKTMGEVRDFINRLYAELKYDVSFNYIEAKVGDIVFTKGYWNFKEWKKEEKGQLGLGL